MPLKATDRKQSQKVEVAEKVREIKQRQQNWFKDRDKHLSKTSTSPTDGHKSSGPPRALLRQTHTISSPTPHKTPQYEPDAYSSNKKGSGFENWLQARQNHKDGDNYTASDEESDFRSATNEQLLSRTSHRSLSPEMFNTLADQIINKVKKQFKAEPNAYQVEDDGQNGLKANESEIQSMKGTNGRQSLQSHHCQVCQQIMVAPRYTPLLLIPCGHTYCSPCLEGRDRCPGCDTHVQSVTCNIMMQQIILEYQGENSQRSTPTHRTTPKKHEPKQKARDYQSEYNTLEIRCEVLDSEIENIEERIGKIDNEIRKQDRFAEQISYQEQMIDQEIEELRLKQRKLGEQRQEYLDERHEWEAKRADEEKQMEMTKATIRGLKSDIQKIKRLAGGTPR